jgi:hypothetical protein
MITYATGWAAGAVLAVLYIVGVGGAVSAIGFVLAPLFYSTSRMVTPPEQRGSWRDRIGQGAAVGILAAFAVLALGKLLGGLEGAGEVRAGADVTPMIDGMARWGRWVGGALGSFVSGSLLGAAWAPRMRELVNTDPPPPPGDGAR